MALKDKTAKAAEAEAQAAATNGGEKKPRKEREEGPVWTPGMQLQLAKVLKDPQLGSVKTAFSVYNVLKDSPEFQGVNLTPARVGQFVKSIIKQREKDKRPIGDHLILASSRSKVEVELFD